MSNLPKDQEEQGLGPPAAESLLERAAAEADAVGAECEEMWNANGGEEGTPSWIAAVPEKEWRRQCWRYTGAGGADAAEEIAKRIRALVPGNAPLAAPPSLNKDPLSSPTLTDPSAASAVPATTVSREELRALLKAAVPGAEELGRKLQKVFRLPDDDLRLDSASTAPALPSGARQQEEQPK